jgi:Trypsin-co-occurring domain 1
MSGAGSEMAQTTVVNLGDGQKLYFGGTQGSGLGEVSARGAIAAVAVAELEKAFAGLGNLIAMVQKGIEQAGTMPSKTEIEFGVSIEGKCDIHVFSGSANADFKVTLSWDK